MPNKLMTTAVAAAALAFCGQSFAQYPGADKTGKVPNVNATYPDDADTKPQKTHKSHAKKSKPSKKSTEPKSDGTSPSTAGDSATPSQ